ARRLDRDVRLAGRNAEALGEQLEVVDQRFHRLVDARTRRRGDLAVLDAVVAERHALDALSYDLHRLQNLVEPDLVAVEDIAVLGVDHVEVDLVVRKVRLRPTEVPREPGRAQDRPGGAEGKGLLRVDHADAHSALAPNWVLAEQVVVLADTALDLVAQLEDLALPAVGQ